MKIEVAKLDSENPNLVLCHKEWDDGRKLHFELQKVLINKDSVICIFGYDNYKCKGIDAWLKNITFNVDDEQEDVFLGKFDNRGDDNCFVVKFKNLGDDWFALRFTVDFYDSNNGEYCDYDSAFICQSKTVRIHTYCGFNASPVIEAVVTGLPRPIYLGKWEDVYDTQCETNLITLGINEMMYDKAHDEYHFSFDVQSNVDTDLRVWVKDVVMVTCDSGKYLCKNAHLPIATLSANGDCEWESVVLTPAMFDDHALVPVQLVDETEDDEDDYDDEDGYYFDEDEYCGDDYDYEYERYCRKRANFNDRIRFAIAVDFGNDYPSQLIEFDIDTDDIECE